MNEPGYTAATRSVLEERGSPTTGTDNPAENTGDISWEATT